MANKNQLFDESVVKTSYVHGSPYDVEYFMYYDPAKAKRLRRPKNPVKEYNAKRLQGVCFSALLRQLGTYKDEKNPPNRICYHMKECASPAANLTLGEKEAWIKMCKKYGMLPKYVPVSAIKDGIVTINITNLPVSLLYCYLASFRHIREETGFVRSMVYLVNNKKMHFYAAYVLASKITIGADNKIHHPGEWSRSYLEKELSINTVKVLARDIIALTRFIKGPGKYDTRCINTEGNSWQCKKHMQKAFSKDFAKLDGKQLLDPKVINALEAADPKKAYAILMGEGVRE